MPEGVEVRISAELIRPLIQNQLILSVETSPNGRYAKTKPEGFEEFSAAIQSEELWKRNGWLGMRVLDIQTRGKFMYWSFSDDWYLFSTFGMTGQWSQKEGKHPCLTFLYTYDLTSSSQQQMVFNDPRHFGTIKFVHGKQELDNRLNELGWDPLGHPLDEVWTNFVVNTLKRTTKPIGEILMDQSVFAGVGNYIRAEALYLAKISPWRPCNMMSKDEIQLLCQSLIDVMKESYQHQGATILTYKNAYGDEGKYSSCFKVYGRGSDPLGNVIKKENMPKRKTNVRTIHWCPAVQK